MSDLQGRYIEITGIVQGVGFRPFIYRLAHELDLVGWVCNTSGGVQIAVEGSLEALDGFVDRIPGEAPPIAYIASLQVQEADLDGFEQFEIVPSRDLAQEYQLISPDVATCPDCVEELRDPANRRYRYPFTNCTNCGPRFTIIEGIPYDRPRTTMASFAMCPDCQAEYDNPLDRRFHAQPNACPVCGPQVALLDSDGRPLAECDAAMVLLAQKLAQGEIAAIKGLGGFQLACDATNAKAVATLRERKHRPDKPLAIMVRDLAMARRYACVSPKEETLLTSPAAPIVLLSMRQGIDLAKGLAPGQRTVGIMLPYTPLHHILLGDVGRPLVMTSGNLSEEPIAQHNDEALSRLVNIADCILVHNRDIHSRYDDSVMSVTQNRALPVRRARGYAPNPVQLPMAGPPTLAYGPELKNTFCLTRDHNAFVSQHIGDMQNLETIDHFQATLALYKDLFRVEPELLAHDMHPDYATTRIALDQPGQHVAVQHHHAHMVSCLADNGHTGPAIGVIWDGTGYGLDGSIWGGEFLVGDAQGFVRAAHLEALPLPGGDAGVRNPYRIAAAYLLALGQSELPETLGISPSEQEIIAAMVHRNLRVTLTSSAGRLFDVAASMLGVRRRVSYEGQAAIELEQLVDEACRQEGVEPWPYSIDEIATKPATWGHPPISLESGWLVRLGDLVMTLAQASMDGTLRSSAAYRFHVTSAAMIADTCQTIAEATGLRTVALSGGCFQNRLLVSLVTPLLAARGYSVFMHRNVPPNDGGVSLGQALVAQAQYRGD